MAQRNQELCEKAKGREREKSLIFHQQLPLLLREENQGRNVKTDRAIRLATGEEEGRVRLMCEWTRQSDGGLYSFLFLIGKHSIFVLAI